MRKPQTMPTPTTNQNSRPNEDAPRIPKTDHVYHECKDENCFTCVAALVSCVVCNGAEGSLTTDCPAIPLNTIMQDMVMANKLDFVDGSFIDPRKQVEMPEETKPTLTRVGVFMGMELYSDTSLPEGEWKLVDISGESLKLSLPGKTEKDLTCVRAGCFHTKSVHHPHIGCKVEGCDCEGFVRTRETIPHYKLATVEE